MATPELDETNHGSGNRHGVSSANPSGNQRDEDAHAAAVGDWLNAQVQTHKIEHLFVIASPRTLGELRHRYSKAVQAALAGELAKDLIGRQPSEVLAALRHEYPRLALRYDTGVPLRVGPAALFLRPETPNGQS